METLVDLGGTHSTIDTYLKNSKSMTERGFGADSYGTRKTKSYTRIIADRRLSFKYVSFTFESYGAFAPSTHKFIAALCGQDRPKHLHNLNPWTDPGPKRDFILSIAAGIQKSNTVVLWQAANRTRRSYGSMSPPRRW